MKRSLFKIAIFLFLGAIINILAAWSCALWSGTNSEVSISSNLGGKEFDPALVPKRVQKIHESYLLPELKVNYEINSSRLATSYYVYTIRSLENAKHFMETASLHVGWPVRSLAAYHIYYIKPGETNDETDRIIEVWESGTLFVLGERRTILGRPLWPPQKLLPYYPIWLGFAINTILYAIAMKVLLFIPWMLRRNSRLLKGQCLKCSYSLRGNYSSCCPECGWGGKRLSKVWTSRLQNRFKHKLR